jgi:biotin carboxyl carrier protein
MVYEVTVDGIVFKIELQGEGSALSCKVNGQSVAAESMFLQPGGLSLVLEGRSHEVHVEPALDGSSIVTISHAGTVRQFSCEVRDPRALRGRKVASAGADGPKKIIAPMPGKVVRILAPAGTEVEQGQGVVVIEAMKMQNELKAPKSGKVVRVMFAEGATVNPGDTLAVIE